MMDVPSDAQLLEAFARTRAEASFVALVRRHLDLVHSAACRLTRDAHLAEDVSQEVFVVLPGPNGPARAESSDRKCGKGRAPRPCGAGGMWEWDGGKGRGGSSGRFALPRPIRPTRTEGPDAGRIV